MADPVKPERITKPIQLLAAWLAGLLAIDTCFLIAAGRFPVDSWETCALVVAAIANVPMFLVAVFLLQTKFRPEMQEDAYYATYLGRKTNETITVSKDDAQVGMFVQRLASVEAQLSRHHQTETLQGSSLIADLSIGVNKYLSDHEAIEQGLAKAGVVAYTEFGAMKAPEHRIVAVSQYLSEETRRAVLDIARALGFKLFTVYDNVAEDSEEDVLFGAYGKPQGKLLEST